MKNDFVSNLATLSAIVYTVKHIVYRIIISIKPIGRFYQNRSILPSVRVWDNKILYTIYNHIFSIFETTIFTLIFLSVYKLGLGRDYFIAILILYIVVTTYKEVYFVYILSVYPKSLLLMDIIVNAILSFVSFFTLYFLIQYFRLKSIR